MTKEAPASWTGDGETPPEVLTAILNERQFVQSYQAWRQRLRKHAFAQRPFRDRCRAIAMGYGV